MKVWQQVKTVILEVEQFASTITSAAAVVFSAVDPSRLPPKYAAIVIGVSNVTRLADKALPVIQAKTQQVFANATAALGHLRLNEKATNAQIRQFEANTPMPSVPPGGTSDPTS